MAIEQTSEGVTEAVLLVARAKQAVFQEELRAETSAADERKHKEAAAAAKAAKKAKKKK